MEETYNLSMTRSQIITMEKALWSKMTREKKNIDYALKRNQTDHLDSAKKKLAEYTAVFDFLNMFVEFPKLNSYAKEDK